MKKKTIVKIATTALMAAMIAMNLNGLVLATEGSGIDTIPTGTSSASSGTFSSILKIILGIVQVIGIAIAVIMLIVLAIRYVSAAPGDKAEIKQHAVIYVVGAAVLFGASGLLEIIKQFATNTLKTTPVST